MRKLLISAPNFDIATKYGNYYYNNYVAKSGTENNFEVIVLNGEYAIKPNFIYEIDENDPILISGVGHGNEDVFTGQNGNILMKVDDTETKRIAKNRHFVLLSCRVGKKLGEKLIDYGGIAFHGYNDDFIFMVSSPEPPDSLSQWFMNPHCSIEFELHRKATHREAYERACINWEYSLEHAPERCKPYVLHDYEHYVFYGDFDTKIVPEEPEPPEKCPYWINSICTNPDCIKCRKTCKCEEPEFWKCISRLIQKYITTKKSIKRR